MQAEALNATGRTATNRQVVLNEFYESERHVDVLVWLAADAKPAGQFYCEHEPAHIDRFRRAGYDDAEATTDLDAGIAEVRKRLEADGNLSVSREDKVALLSADDAHLLSDFLPDTAADDHDQPDDPVVGLLVSDHCRHLVREFLGYKEEHVVTAAAQDHALDALRYAYMGVAGW